MGFFQDHLTMGTVIQCLTMVTLGLPILSKLTTIAKSHERYERWMMTLWEDYNQRYNGPWRIAPGEPSERLHIYVSPEKGAR